MTSLIILLSLLMDRLFAEPKRLHPLVGFGNTAAWLENKLNIPFNMAAESTYSLKNRLLGLFACLLLTIIPTVMLIYFIYNIGSGFRNEIILEIFMFYLVLGSRSLEEHALQVKISIENDDVENARKNVSYMVSRNTEQLNEEAICKATIESVLENGNDAIFAPLFWFVIAGAPGAVCYRLVNTLDAMWGYHNERFRDFGWACAKLDDVLNWIPSRLTAISYAMVGRLKQGLHCWKIQASLWESPNAGPVMASGAGALNLQLGGPAMYDNEIKMRPLLGLGQAPQAIDIERAIKLVRKTIVLWILFVLIIDSLSWYF